MLYCIYINYKHKSLKLHNLKFKLNVFYLFMFFNCAFHSINKFINFFSPKSNEWRCLMMWWYMIALFDWRRMWCGGCVNELFSQFTISSFLICIFFKLFFQLSVTSFKSQTSINGGGVIAAAVDMPGGTVTPGTPNTKAKVSWLS